MGRQERQLLIKPQHLTRWFIHPRSLTVTKGTHVNDQMDEDGENYLTFFQEAAARLTGSEAEGDEEK